jgi:hypothetical protein
VRNAEGGTIGAPWEACCEWTLQAEVAMRKETPWKVPGCVRTDRQAGSGQFSEVEESAREDEPAPQRAGDGDGQRPRGAPGNRKLEEGDV